MVQFEGLRTVIYGVTDVAAARDWYAKALGFPPYFDQPYYVGFQVGGFELGLNPDPGPVTPGSNGVVAYWSVDDIQAAYQLLLSIGAKPGDPVKDVGEGILVGTVLDPFGNVFGLIHNPHDKAGG